MKPDRADRWYRRLLALFPAEFRADFGDAMRADFEDETRDARRRGAGAVVRLWLRTIAGVLRVGPREHLTRLTLDARHGLRLALRRPGPTLASALVLGLGIASLTATFTIADAFLLRPLPFADAGRLVHVWTTERTTEDVTVRSSWPDVQAWAHAAGVEDIAAFNYTEEELVAAGAPERIHAARVSAGIFRLLGAAPGEGRAFVDGEDAPGATAVAIVSAGFAERRFGDANGAIGRQIRVGGVTHEIVGVLPAAFVFPLPVTEVWLPYRFDPATFTRDRLSLQVVARLAPGVSPAAAAAELHAIARASSEAHGDRVPRGASIEPLRDALNFADEIFRIGGPVLMLASALILLVACGNVSNVLLGASLGRAREAGVRAALGASRLRLVRQFAFEQSALVAASAVLGVLLAQAVLRGVSAVIPPDLYRVGDLALDARSLVFGVAAAALAVVATALVPAARLGRADLTTALRSSGPSHTAAPRALRLQHVLVGLQISASVALVAATFTALQALGGLTSRDAGFDRRDALTMKFILAEERYPTGAAIAAFHEDVTGRVRQLPGVTAAATVNHLPLNHEAARITYAPDDAPPAPGTPRPSTTEIVVSSGYFAAMGIPLQEGRDFDGRDTAAGVAVGVVNRALAERLWPGERAVGRRLQIGESGAVVEVAGVAANARHRELTGADEPILYRPMAQTPRRHARLVVRAAGGPPPGATSVQQAVWSVDAALPLTEVRTLDEVVREFLLPQRAMSASMAVLGASALAVAATGLYGLLALLVAQRHQEIGIRLALGASVGGVIRAIAVRVIATATIGLIVGLGLSGLLARGLAALLPGASAADPWALLLTPVVLLLVAATAAIVPVRRAARVDPLAVLRDS